MQIHYIDFFVVVVLKYVFILQQLADDVKIIYIYNRVDNRILVARCHGVLSTQIHTHTHAAADYLV